MVRLARVFVAAALIGGPAIAAELPPASAEAALSALALGASTDLTGPGDESALWARLYKTPADSPTDCTPETHGICAFHYLLAVAEKDEAPRSAVFDLGVLGDVIATQPLRSEADDTVRLRLLVLSRAQAAALQAPAAGLSVEILDVTIGLDRAYSEAPAPE